MNRQRGFIHISDTGLAVALVVVGVCGWGLIEGARWLIAHVSVSFVP